MYMCATLVLAGHRVGEVFVSYANTCPDPWCGITGGWRRYRWWGYLDPRANPRIPTAQIHPCLRIFTNMYPMGRMCTHYTSVDTQTPRNVLVTGYLTPNSPRNTPNRVDFRDPESGSRVPAGVPQNGSILGYNIGRTYVHTMDVRISSYNMYHHGSMVI